MIKSDLIEQIATFYGYKDKKESKWERIKRIKLKRPKRERKEEKINIIIDKYENLPLNLLKEIKEDLKLSIPSLNSYMFNSVTIIISILAFSVAFTGGEPDLLWMLVILLGGFVMVIMILIIPVRVENKQMIVNVVTWLIHHKKEKEEME